MVCSGEGWQDPVLGTILPGGFRVDARIAAGSFGEVYRAHQLTVDRDVAVKIVRAGVEPSSEDGRLFIHEIQAVARIDHRNVVRVYQADVTAEGRLFFAMELLDGHDLERVVSDGTLEPARAVALALQLLAALDAAHQAGLVHADVKPGNAILVASRADERLVLVDFGLARLRMLDAHTTSIGGTPAFMAPEQLRAGRLDARSDQFSAALVLVALLTGWRRRRARDLAPPDDVLATIGAPAVRAALAIALAIAPDDRFPSVAAFAAALAGDPLAAGAPPQRPAFHGLAAFTEDDRGRLHGRDRELAQLTELALYRQLAIVTAPSGVGKTSLLRAGLAPRLGALSIEARYVSCRTDDEPALAAAIEATSATLERALAAPRASPIVLLVDQVEAALEAADGASARAPTSPAVLLDAAAAVAARHGAHVHVVLSVREDFLARLLDRLPDRGDGAPILRIGPLDGAGARDAILRPLAERHITVEPDLLDQLVADLVAAGLQLGAELGWSAPSPVYPPHLQLACSMLLDRLPEGATALSLAHYRKLGGFTAIVGEHLERVLDELAPGDAAAARELFLALVGSTQLRAARTDAELADVVPADHRLRLPATLELLRRQGLVVRTRRPGGELGWELIHDSLVPRVLAWIDRRDLSRRRAMELVRHHLRRTRSDVPSLLSRPELREVDAHPDALAALDAEWRLTRPDPAGERPWTPAALVARSRLVHRRSTVAAFALGLTVIAGIGAAAFERWQAGNERREEAVRRDRDLGLVTFELAPFDWDAENLRAVPVAIAELPALAWTLVAPKFDDPDAPGDPLPAERFGRFAPRLATDGLTSLHPAEAPGGAAFLVITGRGRRTETCAPSIIPLRSLPGYARRSAGPQLLRIRIPTCQTTRADTIEVAAGPFIFGGLGQPPSSYQRDYPARATEQTVDLASYRIDRTEVINAAFAVFSSMADATGIAQPSYDANKELAEAGHPRSPTSAVTWREARAYCRFLGKRLPSSEEWDKAMRGGLTIAGQPNAFPRRNFPWGILQAPHQANLKGEGPPGPRQVGSFAADRSPYGILDLAGNVGEWIGSPDTGNTDPAKFYRQVFRVVRGGNWQETDPSDLVNYTPIENARFGDTRTYTLGWRCAI